MLKYGPIIPAEKRGRVLLYHAKKRANAEGLPFNLRGEDVHVPEFCESCAKPMKFNKGKHGPDSPSLDKVRPALGYVRGNIGFICYRCNAIKRDATPEELLAVALYVHKHTARNIPQPGQRGSGGVFLRGRFWWCHFYRHGKEHRISSKSENRADAEKLLRKLTGAGTVNRLCNRCGRGHVVSVLLCVDCIERL